MASRCSNRCSSASASDRERTALRPYPTLNPCLSMSAEQKPSRNEDEYFAKLNAELIKERRASLDAARAQSDRKAHQMKCPKCGGDLKEMEHHNVKVDQCTDCKGIWLDVGEIELLEHAHESGITRFFSSMFGRRG